MTMIALAGYGLAAVAVMMSVLWAVSLYLRDASIVDRFWGAAFVVLAWVYAGAAGSTGGVAPLLLVLVTIWGLRLSIHIHLRNRSQGEDYRYRRMRDEYGARFWWYSLFSVFLLQAFIAWVVAAPILFVMASPEPVHASSATAVATAIAAEDDIPDAIGRSPPKNRSAPSAKPVTRANSRATPSGNAAQPCPGSRTSPRPESTTSTRSGWSRLRSRKTPSSRSRAAT